jgi:beta-glucosidase/6-phospho-beta-glucosidase/beta-galactosidase
MNDLRSGGDVEATGGDTLVERAIAWGVPVRGYNYGSITSNREWGHPFDPNTDFGLYFVDLVKDPTLARIPTAEVAAYQEIIRTVGT